LLRSTIYNSPIDIFALGDCAACPCPDEDGGRGGIVPPRAQAAHQQASHLFEQIKRRLSNKSLRPYRYKDFGSLVSLGKFSTVGNMMGGLIGKNLMIEGYFAKLMYLSLYKLHELAIHGFIKTSLKPRLRCIVMENILCSSPNSTKIFFRFKATKSKKDSKSD
jgi:NADH dehydrogenase